VPVEELEKGFREGIGFDGSAIEGFARVEEADMLARPDPSTFRVLPGTGEPVGRLLCDITYPDGTPFEGDPRYVLKRNLDRAAQAGYSLVAGPEIEFFLSRSPERFEPLDHGGYFDLTALEPADEKRAVSVLEGLDVRVVMVHHEDAPGQYEIDLAPGDAFAVADGIMTVRLVLKQVAREQGLYATFMPKPAPGIQGSGMHTHFQLLEGERNAFFDATDEARLSKVGRSFIAGLLEHAPALTAVTNQWVNSYKRLVPGFEAPVHVSWARRNRSALVRVPADRPDDERACRIEYRAADPACNPYLAFSVILAAGLDGVRRALEPPAEATENLHAISKQERRAAGIRSLPDNLHDAIVEMERSELVAEALGEHVFEWFIRNKREEWDSYRAYVTPWEIERSFPLL
jgi:glutamine synthetase